MIIAIETATEVCSTAIVHHGLVVSVRSLHERNVHSERLLSLIDEVLRESGISKEQIESVAVSIGPGSFTGLRIGLSVAKGLAMGLNVPILAVPTLDGIAEAFRMEKKLSSKEKFCAIIDAKREEAFYAFYSCDGNDIHREGSFSISQKNEILFNAQNANAVVQQPAVTASSIGLLAERKHDEYLLQDFLTLEPLYLRDFVATFPKNNA